MKHTGLKNRFSLKVRNVWVYWYSCMFCGRNHQDVLHHIISPSSRFYVDGDHNESVFNSCPIHNYGCHIGNESVLYSEETIRKLLERVAMALIDDLQYKPDERDIRFFKVYKKLYDKVV
jgi:hypothetical protein